MGARMSTCQWSNLDVAPFHYERLTLGDARSRVDRHRQFAIADAVNLQRDESPWVRLIHRFVHDVIDHLSVDVGGNAWSFGDDPQFVPALVDEMRVAFVDHR